MRPACFQSLSVRRCVRQSSRLWICIRSIRRVRSRRSDCSICDTPASRPRVQTLVARKSLSVIARSVARSPTTDSAAPYIGEESTTRPPRPTNCRRTSLSGARSAAEAPTSKVRHVPTPTVGIRSPLDGMGDCRIEDAAPARGGPGAPPPPNPPTPPPRRGGPPPTLMLHPPPRQLGAERDLAPPHRRAQAQNALGHGEAWRRVEPPHVGEAVGALGELGRLVDQRQSRVELGLHQPPDIPQQ